MLNWRELPFVRLLLPFMAGILLALYFNYPIPHSGWGLIGLVVLLHLAHRAKGLYHYRWMYGALLTLVLLIFGYGMAVRHNELNHKTHFSNILPLGNGNIFTGTVSGATSKKENWVKIRLTITAIGTETHRLTPCTGNLLLYLSRDSTALKLNHGDKLVINGRATPIGPPKNPNAFDYGRYLHFQNIHFQAFVREGDWALAERRDRFSLTGTAISLQRYFTEILRKHLPTENEFAVGAALILGYRDEIPEEVRTAYAQTGAMHVLAVSGLHVGIVFLILNFFLKRVKWNIPAWRYAKVVIILAAIWAFAFVTGASPSVTRATVMFSFVTVGDAMFRHKNFYNTLAASAFCLLCYNPYWLASVSFQLSYLAVFGIVYFQPKFSRLLNIKIKWLDYCWQLICVSLAAQLMTLPLTLYYFNQFPTYFWLSSLLLVPLAGIELGLGLLLLLTESTWQAGAVWVGKALWLLLMTGNEAISIIQKLPGAVVKGIWIGVNAAVLLYMSLSGFMAALGLRKMKWAITSLLLLLIVGVHRASAAYKHIQSKRLVVYHLNKQTAIDFFDGKTAYSLTGSGVDKKSLGFAVDGFRYTNGIDKVIHHYLDDTNGRMSDNWFLQNGFVQFHGLRMIILSSLPDWPAGEKIPVDLLLIHGSPKTDMAALAELFDFKTLLFDASSKTWLVEKWKKQCEDLGLPYHDVNVEGAFVLDLQG